jgi:putative heme-binding domain-containing protein
MKRFFLRTSYLTMSFRAVLLVSVFWTTSSICAPLFAAESGQAQAPLSEDEQKTALAVEALTRLQNVDLNQSPKLKQAVLKTLDRTRGSANFLKLVQHFKLTDQTTGLLEVALRNSTNEAGVEAARLILSGKEANLLQETLQGTNSERAVAISQVLANIADKKSTELLLPLLSEPNIDPRLRRNAVRGLVKTEEGAAALVERAEKLPDDLKFTASTELSRVRWPEIKAKAAKALPLPAGQNNQQLPPIEALLRMKGDPVNGAKLFASPVVACSTCHRVKGQGVEFGPDLSEIGAKLGKDALYQSILDPSAGISFGYEAFQLQLRSGDEAYGLIANETADEIAIKAIGGIVTRYKKTDVLKREQMKLSIMPTGLQQNMSTQELVDLVEFLSSLKKGK